MSDFEDDIDDQLLELAGATEKKKKRRQPSGGSGAGAGSNGKSSGASKKRRAECVLLIRLLPASGDSVRHVRWVLDPFPPLVFSGFRVSEY